MPATGLKTRFIFNVGLLGFAEALVLGGATSFASAKVKAQNYLKARIKMCGQGVNFVGCVISQLGAPRTYQTFDGVDFPGIKPPVGDNTSGAITEPNTCDQIKSVLQCNADADPTRHKRMYLSGVPDLVVRESPEGPDLSVQPWKDYFDAWVVQVIADGWGFIAQTSPAGAFVPQPILGVGAELVTNLITINLASDPGFIAGVSTVLIRGNTRINPAYKGMNGKWVVKSKVTAGGVTTLTLFGTSSIDPTKFRKLGSATLYDTAVFTIGAITDLKQTAHKRGNRFLAPLGRRRVVQRI